MTRINYLNLKVTLLSLLVYTINVKAQINMRDHGNALNGELKYTSFYTTDSALQKIFSLAEEKCMDNIKNFGKYQVLVEGATYPNVWLETQPMGGEMYAKRNIKIAKNNQMIFIDYQRKDGRLPGMISVENNQISPQFSWLQGFCFPAPAFDLYYWLAQDKDYLLKLYSCLERFDTYLWKTRDSDGDGCLESWCVYDTGEDNSVRLNGAPLEWQFEYPPTQDLVNTYHKEVQGGHNKYKSPVPMESMDVISYSYSARHILSKISEILNNGKTSYWKEKAGRIRVKIKSYLWDNTQYACYDRDPENRTVNILLINNIKCMYYGSFDQKMADAFIKKHLLNREEFWTATPLPCIAINSPVFKNLGNNNWGGQPQGLTFQRAIRALENYGHYSEITLIGHRLISTLKQNFKFTQQYDTFTRVANSSLDGYGPTALSLLEYVSRMYGIHYEDNMILWSGLEQKNGFSKYEQIINNNKYVLQIDENKMSAFINNKLVFKSSSNIRCVTDLAGRLKKIIGIDTCVRKVTVSYPKVNNFLFNVKPNCIYQIRNNTIYMSSSIPFDYNK